MNEKNFYKDIIDNLYDGVYFVNRQRVITYWNKGAERITGYQAGQVMGHSCSENILNHVTVNGMQLCQNHCPLTACIQDGKTHQADVFLHHADGHRVPVSVRAAPMYDEEGAIIGAVETFSSDSGVTALHQELRELRQTSRVDQLTGISNRAFIEGRLHAVLSEIEHQPDTAAGLLFIDIDHFKLVNDTYGHDNGDKVLRMVASTMRHNLRKTDVVGRWGGEEFIAILYDVATPESLYILAEKLRTLVECSRLDIGNISLTVTVSVGATRFLPTDTFESVVRRCDELMYDSKRSGRNRVTIG